MTEHLKHADVRRICMVSGLQEKLMKRKASLADAARTLRTAIRDVEQAAKDEYFWRAMEVAAKVVQVSCDLAIAALEENRATGVAGKAVSVGYDAAKRIVDAFNGGMSVKQAVTFSANNKVDALVYHLETTQRRRFSKVIGRTKTLLNLADDLYSYWNERGADLTGKSTLMSARLTLLRQLRRIEYQIREVESSLADCTRADSAQALNRTP